MNPDALKIPQDFRLLDFTLSAGILRPNFYRVKNISIEGVIGAGKTSLAKKIGERLNAKLIFEQFEHNPFLEKFYVDRKRFAFQTQMFFLINRFKQQQELNQEDLFSEHLVCDYIFE